MDTKNLTTLYDIYLVFCNVYWMIPTTHERDINIGVSYRCSSALTLKVHLAKTHAWEKSKLKSILVIKRFQRKD
jgi:hypothetical protein